MKQSVDAPEIDESAEIGDVLDDALTLLADLQLCEQLFLLLLPLFFENDSPGYDDIAPSLVQLDDLAFEILASAICEPGRNASTLISFTTRPPLILRSTVVFTTVPIS